MLLTIDIGNSFTKFGVFENDSLIAKFSIPTDRNQSEIEIGDSQLNQSIDSIFISSVVPELETAYRVFSRQKFNLEPVFVDASFDFDLKINYFPAKNLGIDRLINAFAATGKYGKPCIACSFGTATTIDAVSSKGEFLGGIIAPGMKLMSDALFLKTAKLPQVAIEKPPSVFGNSTARAIQSGIYFGSIGLIDGIIARMTDEMKEMPRIVATGGFAKIIAETSKKIEIIDENLTLEGLRLIYEKRLR